MTKIAAIILSFTVLFQSFNFDLTDVQKIPTLVAHFSCHLEKGDNLSDFVSLHYGSSIEKHQEDHHEHKELPFKHQHIDSHFQLAFLIGTNSYPINHSDSKVETNNFNYKEPSSQLFENNFFQPPKIA